MTHDQLVKIHAGQLSDAGDRFFHIRRELRIRQGKIALLIGQCITSDQQRSHRVEHADVAGGVPWRVDDLQTKDLIAIAHSLHCLNWQLADVCFPGIGRGIGRRGQYFTHTARMVLMIMSQDQMSDGIPAQARPHNGLTDHGGRTLDSRIDNGNLIAAHQYKGIDKLVEDRKIIHRFQHRWDCP